MVATDRTGPTRVTLDEMLGQGDAVLDGNVRELPVPFARPVREDFAHGPVDPPFREDAVVVGVAAAGPSRPGARGLGGPHGGGGAGGPWARNPGGGGGGGGRRAGGPPPRS